jgi:hypothetical protein
MWGGQRDRSDREAAVVHPALSSQRVADPLGVERVATRRKVSYGSRVVSRAVGAEPPEAHDVGELTHRLERRPTAGARIAGVVSAVYGMAGADLAGDAFEVPHCGPLCRVRPMILDR